jgi:hypothetical protein
VRVLEPFTPRRGRCIYCGVRIYVRCLS